VTFDAVRESSLAARTNGAKVLEPKAILHVSRIVSLKHRNATLLIVGKSLPGAPSTDFRENLFQTLFHRATVVRPRQREGPFE